MEACGSKRLSAKSLEKPVVYQEWTASAARSRRFQLLARIA